MNGYPINWPLARFAGSLGVRIKIRIDVEFDSENSVYIATSPNLKGLVVEAATLDEICREVELVLPDFLDVKFHSNGSSPNNTRLELCTDLHPA